MPFSGYLQNVVMGGVGGSNNFPAIDTVDRGILDSIYMMIYPMVQYLTCVPNTSAGRTQCGNLVTTLFA
jgi:hypothetical protein